MTNAPDESAERRREIATSDQQRQLGAHDYRLMLAMVGILAYSAFGNAVSTIAAFGQGQWVAVAISGLFAALYGFAIFRLWARNDTRAWIVALPAGLAVLLIAIGMLRGMPGGVVPLILNLALLALIPLRARARRQLQAVSATP